MNTDQIPELVQELAIEMTILTGEVWTADIDSDRYAQYIQSETARLWLHYDHWKNRIEISPVKPACVTIRYYDNETITCNADREPEAIAKDITRRILSHARNFQERAIEAQTKHDQEVEATHTTIQIIKPNYSREITDTSADISGDRWRARIYSGEIFTFELSHVTTEQAVKILEILKENQ